jgi:hypothetical protein
LITRFFAGTGHTKLSEHIRARRRQKTLNVTSETAAGCRPVAEVVGFPSNLNAEREGLFRGRCGAKETVLQRSGNRTTRSPPTWFDGISAGQGTSRGARDLVCNLHSWCSMAHPSRNSWPNGVFDRQTKWCILMNLPRAAVQLLYLGAAVVPRLRSPDLPHACCDIAIRRQTMRTIVPHFR